MKECFAIFLIVLMCQPALSLSGCHNPGTIQGETVALSPVVDFLTVPGATASSHFVVPVSFSTRFQNTRYKENKFTRFQPVSVVFSDPPGCVDIWSRSRTSGCYLSDELFFYLNDGLHGFHGFLGNAPLKSTGQSRLGEPLAARKTEWLIPKTLHTHPNRTMRLRLLDMTLIPKTLHTHPVPWIPITRGFPNHLVTALFSEGGVNGFSALFQLAKWQDRQQREIVDATGYIARGLEKLFAQNAYKDAVADFDTVLSLAPQNTDAYYYRATAKLTLGNAESTVGNTEQAQHLYHTAIQDYTQVIEREPENTDAFVFRSYAKFRLGILESAVGNTERAQHHYHAAIADCNQAMAVYRKDEALKAALAIYTEVGVHSERVIEIRESYGFAYYLRGLEKQALGQQAAAEADFRKARALQLKPESVPLAPTLGRRSS